MRIPVNCGLDTIKCLMRDWQLQWLLLRVTYAGRITNEYVETIHQNSAGTVDIVQDWTIPPSFVYYVENLF